MQQNLSSPVKDLLKLNVKPNDKKNLLKFNVNKTCQAHTLFLMFHADNIRIAPLQVQLTNQRVNTENVQSW
jgi:hypothetical protein